MRQISVSGEVVVSRRGADGVAISVPIALGDELLDAAVSAYRVRPALARALQASVDKLRRDGRIDAIVRQYTVQAK